jgi:two-component sensor histidine kinase/PAS domain-containing protein
MPVTTAVRTSFPPGDDDMSSAIRGFDWASTELGVIEDWSDALKALVALMLGSAQPMFMAWGRDKVWLYNQAFVPILGKKHPAALGSTAPKVWAEAWSDLEPLVESVYGGSPVHMADINLMLDRNGSPEEAHFSFSYNPAFDATGTVSGLFGVCTETTAQDRTRRDLATMEGRLQMALSAGNSIGTWDWDVLGDRVTSDARFARLYGIDPALAATGAPIGQFFVNVQAEDLARLQLEIAEAMRTGEAFGSEYRIVQHDGSVRWVMAQGQAALDGAGNALYFPGVTLDITDRKQAEAQHAVLRNELQHRNKNLMAMISAISTQTLRGDDIKVRRDAFNERLMALARAQDILTATSWVGAPIHEVIRGTTSHQDDRFVINGPPLTLDAKRALSLALAVHELTTNSIKYGALSVPDGTVAITWSVKNGVDATERAFRFEWQDRGGPKVKEPKTEGFGSRLIKRMLAADFAGEVSIEYRLDGVRVVLTGTLQSSDSQP